jgi:hypothetical protein
LPILKEVQVTEFYDAGVHFLLLKGFEDGVASFDGLHAVENVDNVTIHLGVVYGGTL